MAPSKSRRDELLELLALQVDGELDLSQRKSLQALLREEPELLELYLRHCEMHALLSEEQELLAEIAAEAAPDNVVPLPVEPNRESVEPYLSSDPAASHVPYAVAACLLLGLIIAGVVYFEDHRDAEGSQSGPLAAVVDHSRPLSAEEEYINSLEAMADGGSQRRPPTPFASTMEPEEGIDFNRQIRPILSDNCFRCHGPDAEDREADLRLDTAAGIVADLGGYAAVAPGDPEASELVARIFNDDPDEVMPPPDSHKKLDAGQKELLRRWIAEGGEWRAHWAFEPITRPEVSAAAASESPNVNPIDAFIRARLAKKGLVPSPRAGRATLLRRVSLDLTGLPPTPREIQAFLEDPADAGQAYGRVVDRLLASPRYGEHRARYWLDAARYGDTHGLHLDNYREIWPYRDWVIEAFNDNMPFDRFTVEQLAGDLLPEPTLAQRVATGFNRCNVTTSEGGAISEEFDVRYGVDRVATTATVWMGLTAGCATCHDHKYDPLKTREFYQLMAYFNNTTQEAMDGNIEDTPPVVRLYASREDEAMVEKLETRISGFDKRLKKLRGEAAPAFEAWLGGLSAADAKEQGHLDLPGRVVDLGGESLNTASADAAGKLAESSAGEARIPALDQPFTIRLRFRYPEGKRGRYELLSKTGGEAQRGLRVALDGQGLSVELIERWPDLALQVVTNRGFSAGAEREFFLTYDGSGRAEGLSSFLAGKEAGARFNLIRKNRVEGDVDVAAPLKVAVPGTYKDEPGVGVTELEIYDRRLGAAEITALAAERSVPGLLAKALKNLAAGPGTGETKAKKTKKIVETEKKNRGTLLEHHLLGARGSYAATTTARARVDTELARVLSRTPTTLVMQEKKGPASAHVLERGEYDKQGDEVFPGVPEILPDLPEDAPPNRLGLARWLVDPSHPLTARVTANRMWQEVFGTGIVRTAEDFGTQGEPPSHPLLLDWLAAEFIESGWDVKALYRKIVLSETYAQSSRITPELLEADPDNRLLARGPRFRLDAEMIRDQALFASGLLVEHLGGPSVKPYQPAGLWKTVGYSGSNTVEFHQDHGEALYRRSLYTFWKRTSHPPNMAAFDAPNREGCTVRRERTNTPLQALVLMNDPQYVEAAR
ncbi:MAG: PSD1 and planctomycete cytochrome C domain-containing protein, partial [Verrucomicrobiales bacterium]